MTTEELERIFETADSEWEGDNALQGLNIIQKYFPGKTVLEAAEHDVIYSVNPDELLEAGLTEEDAAELSKLNWMIDSEFYCMACFV